MTALAGRAGGLLANLERWHREIVRIVALPDVNERLRTLGFDPVANSPAEFAERITFTAQLMPSRTDVPEYAEYLEKIEALVAVVNHRHGTPDWMPIDLKLRDDLDEAVASYKHYDVMMVNAMFDGMNLVAEGLTRLLRNDASDHIGRAASREGHDHADRFGRIGLGRRGKRANERGETDEAADHDPHGVLP